MVLVRQNDMHFWTSNKSYCLIISLWTSLHKLSYSVCNADILLLLSVTISIACRLFITKPLSESMLGFVNWTLRQQIFVKFESKYKMTDWKCLLQNGRHFILSSMCTACWECLLNYLSAGATGGARQRRYGHSGPPTGDFQLPSADGQEDTSDDPDEELMRARERSRRRMWVCRYLHLLCW